MNGGPALRQYINDLQRRSQAFPRPTSVGRRPKQSWSLRFLLVVIGSKTRTRTKTFGLPNATTHDWLARIARGLARYQSAAPFSGKGGLSGAIQLTWSEGLCWT